MRTNDKLFVVAVFLFIAYLCVKDCVNAQSVKVVGNINGYPIVELEDGHYYMRNGGLYNHSVSHYADCPKCKSK